MIFKSAVQLEKEFDRFFESIGYKKVTELVGESPTFENADYINLNVGIITELKIIDKDFFEFGGVIDGLNTIITVPKETDDEGFGVYEFEFPEANRHGKHDTLHEPLRRIFKKANRQIRETKKRLLKDNGIGFVLLALNIKTSVDPEIFRKLAGNILGKEFKSIDGFILCTPTWGMYNRKTGQEHRLCLPTTPYGAPEIIRQSCTDIGKKWIDFANFGGHT